MTGTIIRHKETGKYYYIHTTTSISSVINNDIINSDLYHCFVLIFEGKLCYINIGIRILKSVFFHAEYDIVMYPGSIDNFALCCIYGRFSCVIS